jgi:hypothetical protein
VNQVSREGRGSSVVDLINAFSDVLRLMPGEHQTAMESTRPVVNVQTSFLPPNTALTDEVASLQELDRLWSAYENTHDPRDLLSYKRKMHVFQVKFGRAR